MYKRQVLDEATAFADPENEYKMQMALQSLIKDKTVIVIAHRLSSIAVSYTHLQDSEKFFCCDRSNVCGIVR